MIRGLTRYFLWRTSRACRNSPASRSCTMRTQTKRRAAMFSVLTTSDLSTIHATRGASISHQRPIGTQRRATSPSVKSSFAITTVLMIPTLSGAILKRANCFDGNPDARNVRMLGSGVQVLLLFALFAPHEQSRHKTIHLGKINRIDIDGKNPRSRGENVENAGCRF